MVSRASADRLRRAQAGIRSLVERDLNSFWGSLNLNRPEAARDALLEFMPVLVQSYGESAAAMAADWYDETRAAERVAGRYRAAMVVPDETAAIEATTRRAAGALWTDAPNDALWMIAGRAGKYALAGARETVSHSTFRDPAVRAFTKLTNRFGLNNTSFILEGDNACL